MTVRLARRIATFAAIGFTVDLVFHLLTFLPLDFSRIVGLSFLPFVGMFIPFGAMTADMRRRFGRTHFTNEEMRQVTAPVPASVRTIAMIVMAYVVLNFFLIIISRPNRQAWDARTTIRFFTGHPLIFYFLPAVYFRYIAQ